MSVKAKLKALHDTIPPQNQALEHVKDMLACAENSCNGTQDKIASMAETQGHMALMLARLEMRESSCPFRGGLTGKAAVVYPFRWPIAAILCTAMLVMGGERVYSLIVHERDRGMSTAAN